VLIALVLAAVFSSVLISQRLSFALFYLSLSVFIASLTLRPRYVWLVFVANLLGFAIMFGTIPINTSEPATRELLVGSVTLLGIVTIISFLGSSILARATGRLRVAYLQLEDNAALLARANVDLEAQVAARTVDLQAALQEVRSRADEQERLLAETHQQRAVIREMSVPIIPVSDTVVVIPLVGALDSARLMELQTRTLHAVEQSRVHQLVLDITGVVVVDSQVAQGIIDVVQSARLLGAEVILVGIRPEVAQSIVQLGLQLAGMRTFSTLYAALNAIKSN
jgi:rsbT co-antagonist protein RsbR